ncbi:hypothetical protein KAS10_04845 [Candidatus Aerophobetes bacterium]|nr:hypothetical protein [Candidatus Aerophobetes bacterium]
MHSQEWVRLEITVAGTFPHSQKVFGFDPLQSRISRLIGYPLMDCISQVSSIIVLLGHIVKFGGGIGEVSQTLLHHRRGGRA